MSGDRRTLRTSTRLAAGGLDLAGPPNEENANPGERLP